MTVQNALTVVARIKMGQAGALKALLNPIGDDVLNKQNRTSGFFPFAKLETVHFMRWVVIDAQDDPENPNTNLPDWLALETNYDGLLDPHLDELVTLGGSVLTDIYNFCEDFPPPGGLNLGSVMQYLRDRQISVPTFYIGTRGLSMLQIRKDDELRTALESFLDTRRRNPSWWTQSREQMRGDLVGFVKGNPALHWALTPLPEPSLLSKLRVLVLGLLDVIWRVFLLPGLVFSLALVLGASYGEAFLVAGEFAIALVIALALILLIHELTEPETSNTGTSAQLSPVVQREDHQIQNQMTDVTFVKKGLFRQFTLRSVLWAVNWLARFVFNRGELGGIPSIHFARWVLLDGGRRLLFFSNFDGSWESYLDDFIDKAAHGLTAVWSNAYLFPRSTLLIWGGAHDERRFKPYVRNTQLPTEVWYSAYPNLSVQNINNNARIRRMLVGRPGADEILACLHLL